MAHKTKSKLAGTTVKVKLLGYEHINEIRVDDWWDRLDPAGWLMSGRIAAIMYAKRVSKFNLPHDDEVLYGHGNDGLGYIFNKSEILK